MDKQPDRTNLNDEGTRYQHLCDYRDDLELVLGVMNSRGLHTLADRQRFMKFSFALEVLNSTIDAFAGLKEGRTEYSLYRQINGIGKAEDIMPTRGTPLR